MTYLWECECLGIQNGDGYGDTCANHEVEHEPYCYVYKSVCTAAGITWFESSSTVIDATSIGYSEQLCVCNHFWIFSKIYILVILPFKICVTNL